MDIGRMNRRITLQYQNGWDMDDEGNAVPKWDDFATVWANIRPLRGREYFEAAAVNAETTVKMLIRYRPGITPDMQVVYNGKIYNIQAVIDVYEGRQRLELMCKEVQAG